LKSAEMQHYNKVEYITYFTFVHLLYAELLFFKECGIILRLLQFL